MPNRTGGGDSARYMLTDLRPPPPDPAVQKAAADWMNYLAGCAADQAERLTEVLKSQDPPGIRAMRDYWKTAERALRWAAKTSLQRKQANGSRRTNRRRNSG